MTTRYEGLTIEESITKARADLCAGAQAVELIQEAGDWDEAMKLEFTSLHARIQMLASIDLKDRFMAEIERKTHALRGQAGRIEMWFQAAERRGVRTGDTPTMVEHAAQAEMAMALQGLGIEVGDSTLDGIERHKQLIGEESAS